MLDSDVTTTLPDTRVDQSQEVRNDTASETDTPVDPRSQTSEKNKATRLTGRRLLPPRLVGKMSTK